MPVANYNHIAKRASKKIFEDPVISQKNKQALNRFMDAYEVSPAREGIFLNNITRLLRKTNDIERDMHNKDLMNKIFKELKSEMSLATFETVKNVSHRFVRWLNNGTKPTGFLDIKRIKGNQKRSLEPSDMITWDDGLELVKHTQSIQLKAAVLAQLDCGFRPGEFIDLNYGDITLKDDMVLFNIRMSKTGVPRMVWMHRAVPYFLQWYDNHPTKKKNEPLWILEHTQLSHRKKESTPKLSRYTYATLQHRFNLLKKKAKLEKPVDFYNFRHSSCVLDKLDNVPTDLAAERHGHSVEFYVKTYGRLSVEDKLARVRDHYGEPEEKKQLLKNSSCSRCKAINKPEAEFCQICGVPLSAEQAAKVYSQNQQMEDRLASLEKVLLANPKVKQFLEVYDEKIKKKKS
jgi:integrase